ncbi:hypothetical protein HHE03_01710 [Helicobacter heilmannii]|uniref:Uncharacterized protein n=1 Tax=Helicobacter heilmannii TaxID=35817 RepID=A0A0K2XSV0_HELHE|nr:hypothetical protein HHE03_01710 [Helicobacter heilmannii]CRI35308.1 hypothetical protein HHE01_03060 [Helicobacter heilmannii]
MEDVLRRAHPAKHGERTGFATFEKLHFLFNDNRQFNNL